jgi:hypothetical protein
MQPKTGALRTPSDSSVAPVSFCRTLSAARAWIAAASTGVIVALTASAATATAPEINQHGLTGAWYNPMTSGQGLQVEVYQDLFSPGQGYLQAGWFTFDTAGAQRWYTLSGSVSTGQSSAPLTIYQNIGGNFYAPPVTAAQTVGSANISFSRCDQGMLNYNFNDGRVGSIPLSRLTQNVTCVPTGNAEPVNLDFGLSGNWYNPATAGQGVIVEINNASPVAFFALYTYAVNGASLGAAGQRWLTAQAAYTAGARQVPLTLYETTGGIFDHASPAPTTIPVGTAQLFFQTCSSAVLQYGITAGSFAGQSGTWQLTRVAAVPRYCF